MELEVETLLSRRPAAEANDTTALSSEQQQQLDRHKVRASAPAYSLSPAVCSSAPRIPCIMYARARVDVTSPSHFLQQVTVRLENELYLRKHPEVFTLLSSFVRCVCVCVCVCVSMVHTNAIITYLYSYVCVSECDNSMFDNSM